MSSGNPEDKSISYKLGGAFIKYVTFRGELTREGGSITFTKKLATLMPAWLLALSATCSAIHSYGKQKVYQSNNQKRIASYKKWAVRFRYLIPGLAAMTLVGGVIAYRSVPGEQWQALCLEQIRRYEMLEQQSKNKQKMGQA